MRVYTVTIAIKDDDTTTERKDWEILARALRLAAHEVVINGAPEPGDGQDTYPAGESATVYVSAIDLEV